MVNFRNLPKEAQDMLRDLTFDSAHMLAIEAGVARRAAATAAYPKEVAEAAEAVSELLRRTGSLELEDPLDFAVDVLDVVTAALDARDFDGCHAKPLAALLDKAATAMRSHRENVNEAVERLWVAKQAQK